jgi:hypothetical protein
LFGITRTEEPEIDSLNLNVVAGKISGKNTRKQQLLLTSFPHAVSPQISIVRRRIVGTSMPFWKHVYTLTFFFRCVLLVVQTCFPGTGSYFPSWMKMDGSVGND